MRSYTVKDPERVKKHTFLRGLRSYVSSLRIANTMKPVVMTTQRVSRIVEKLSLSGKNVALLSFHKSMHSAVVMRNAYGTYSYISVFVGTFCFLDHVSKKRVIEEIADDERLLRAELRDSEVVYISGLNTVKMMHHIRVNEYVNKFHYYSNNCSRFAADVLLAGCDTRPAKFQHDRPTWQMPANTTQLAREIDLFLRKKSL